MNKIIKIPNKRVTYMMLHIFFSFFLMGLVSNYLCDSTLHHVLIGAYFVIHLLGGIHLLSNLDTLPIIMDFRSHEQRIEDQKDTEELMILNAKTHLKMEVLKGNLLSEQVIERFKSLPELDNIVLENGANLLSEFVENNL